MPANRFNGFTDYGVGIGLRIPHYQHIFEQKPVVDWFEIISENFMVDGGRPLHVLIGGLYQLGPAAGQHHSDRTEINDVACTHAFSPFICDVA